MAGFEPTPSYGKHRWLRKLRAVVVEELQGFFPRLPSPALQVQARTHSIV